MPNTETSSTSIWEAAAKPTARLPEAARAALPNKAKREWKRKTARRVFENRKRDGHARGGRGGTTTRKTVERCCEMRGPCENTKQTNTQRVRNPERKERIDSMFDIHYYQYYYK
mmetsp:Transcript_26606/g.54966  ORF Transcript_26606/g.54966 Transcript_26606/m.54966 type:complete len:114 (+) Transcript_26606:494-835(+)